MVVRTSDPIADFLRRDAEQREWLESRPVCECCGEPIQESHAFFYMHQWFCTELECEWELMKMVWDDIKSDYLVPVED